MKHYKGYDENGEDHLQRIRKADHNRVKKANWIFGSDSRQDDEWNCEDQQQ